jgi:hypothetical protein
LVHAIALTVTAHVAVFAWSWVVTVIVAEPEATAVTNPLVLTVAMAALLVDHVTVLLVALVGAMVAVSCCVPPTFRAAVVGDIVTPVTITFVTVTTHVAVFPPSAVVTVIVDDPAAFPVTNPLVLTVAIALLLVVHVTDLLVALVGAIVAVSWVVAFIAIDAVVGLIVTPVTGTLLDVTVTAHVAVLP